MNTFRMRWANKSKDALPPFDKMKWLLAVAWVALHNQLIREVLEAWSLVGFGHVFFEWKSSSLLHISRIVGFEAKFFIPHFFDDHSQSIPDDRYHK